MAPKAPPIPFPGEGPPDQFPGKPPPHVELPFSTSKAIALFTAYDGINGFELWVTDGTDAGTMRLKDIWPGDGSSLSFNIQFTVFTIFGDQVLFAANDGINGVELCTTDGTAEGTTLVKDILPGPSSSAAGGFGGFTVFGGETSASASDGGELADINQTDLPQSIHVEMPDWII